MTVQRGQFTTIDVGPMNLKKHWPKLENSTFVLKIQFNIKFTFVIFSIIVEFASGQLEFTKFLAFSFTVYPIVFPIVYKM